MGRVVHFEFSSNNLEASKKFFETVMNWEITSWEGPIQYLLVKTGEKDSLGIDGAIFPPPGDGIEGTINTISVDNLDDSIAKVKANGGEILRPKNEIPGVGWFVYARDPGGIVFGLLEPFPSMDM